MVRPVYAMRAGNACQDDELNLDMKYVKGEGVEKEGEGRQKAKDK
jgi:hypothetical protein